MCYCYPTSTSTVPARGDKGLLHNTGDYRLDGLEATFCNVYTEGVYVISISIVDAIERDLLGETDSGGGSLIVPATSFHSIP